MLCLSLCLCLSVAVLFRVCASSVSFFLLRGPALHCACPWVRWALTIATAAASACCLCTARSLPLQLPPLDACAPSRLCRCRCLRSLPVRRHVSATAAASARCLCDATSPPLQLPPLAACALPRLRRCSCICALRDVCFCAALCVDFLNLRSACCVLSLALSLLAVANPGALVC